MSNTNYREFRLSKLNSDEFKHIKLLLFWPVFGMLFGFVERFYNVDFYYPMHCALDDCIPFNELFLLPYLFWFVFLIGSLIYTFFCDVDSFRRMMKFVMLTYTVTIIIYFVFPTCQNLRPTAFERDNVLTRYIANYYAFDTNTNVCPSIHVLGSFAAAFALGDTKRFSGTAWKIANVVIAVLISVSTVFIKQHSVLDVLFALPLCAVGYLLFFTNKRVSVCTA